MSLRLRTTGRALVWLAAANFAALAVMVASLAFTGAVDAGRWRGALQVLRGSAASMSNEEYERLRAAERELAERGAMPRERILLESWRTVRAAKWELAARGAEQRARLALLASFVEAERDSLERAVVQFRAERAAADDQRRRREDGDRMAASEKLQRLYRYMRPDSIAADLEKRMESGRPEEVAHIVGALPERSAAEVLEAFADPAKRNRIYDLLAGRMPGRQGELAGPEPAPRNGEL